MRYPVWFILLMDHNRNPFAPEAATDEPASPLKVGDGRSARPAENRPPPCDKAAVAAAHEKAAGPAEHDPPGFAEPPLFSDSLGAALEETIADTFPPGCRKPRHDGWGPEQIGGFLRALAATGVVEHAARIVGRSPQSAYNFRNGRQGRAFARMWDAVLIHRTRARVASELSSRAIAGCVSVRKREGVVVSEYHYYDNRLGMSLLTRLDRLAEKEEASDAHLRALSEDLDDFIDCLASGGDSDAFVEERRPPEPEPERRLESLSDDALMRLLTLRRAEDEFGDEDDEIDPRDIEVRDLDPSQRETWTEEQWYRARQSGFVQWLTMSSDPERATGRGDLARFEVSRLAALIAWDAPSASASPAGGASDDEDLDPERLREWTNDQLARAWHGGVIQRLGPEFWDRFARSTFFSGPAR